MTETANAKWIYTYDYAPGQTWSPWRESESPPRWIVPETRRVSDRAAAHKTPDTLTFALLADTHHVVNGTWRDTRDALEQLHKSLKFSGAIHLGDFTDGMVSRELTHKYVGEILGDFDKIGMKLYAVLGNHDCNYFRNNPDRMSVDEQCELYLRGSSPRYFVDYNAQKLRLIFIDSYDVEQPLRYGFSKECADFLDTALSDMPQDYGAVIFSHLTPLVRLQAWAKELRGSGEVMSVLNRHGGKILAYVNGHNHCDLLYNDCAFPIISINCAKCEYFLEHKPDGATSPYRELGEVSQESFDIMTIDTGAREIYFTRFGAGGDRIVRRGKAEWA